MIHCVFGPQLDCEQDISGLLHGTDGGSGTMLRENCSKIRKK